MFKKGGKVAYYAIHSRWLGPKHVTSTASEAEVALQMLTYDGEKKAWNWESMCPNMLSSLDLVPEAA